MNLFAAVNLFLLKTIILIIPENRTKYGLVLLISPKLWNLNIEFAHEIVDKIIFYNIEAWTLKSFAFTTTFLLQNKFKWTDWYNFLVLAHRVTLLSSEHKKFNVSEGRMTKNLTRDVKFSILMYRTCTRAKFCHEIFH